MKCKYCHKNVRSIAHFMQAHKKLMMAKMRRGRSKGKHSGGKRSRGGSGGRTIARARIPKGVNRLEVTVYG